MHDAGEDRSASALPYARVAPRPSRVAARVLWLLLVTSYLMTGAAALITSSSNVSASSWAALDGALVRAATVVSLAAVLVAVWIKVRRVPTGGATVAGALATVLAFFLLTTWF